jgi:hypothetical protein
MQAQAIHLQTMLNRESLKFQELTNLDSGSGGNNIYSKSQLSISLYSKISLQMKKYEFE